MKQQFIHILSCIGLMAAMSLPVGCSRVEQPELSGEPVLISQVRMDVSIDRWDAATKAEGTDTWPDGARILVRLTNGTQATILEVHLYSGEWHIEQCMFNGEGWTWTNPDLSGYSGGLCQCYYFENSEGTEGAYYGRNNEGNYSLQSTDTAIYRDADAIFGIVDGILDFKAHLEPATGRIRFANPGTDEHGYNWFSPGVYGMRRYTVLNANTFELVPTTAYFTTYINSDQTSSPYVFGDFADSERRTLTVVDSKWANPAAYERSFSEDILTAGNSNWSYFPVQNSHNEWYRYDGSIDGWNFGVDGMTMYYVVPGTFRMGGEDAQPVHTVTLTRGFYLSETEITKDMWYRVMGSPSDYANAAVPVTGKTWEEVQAFIAALNAKSGYNFRLPTEAEWEFAARGGMKSNGYIYSGSNDSADVAVQDWNWSMQAVKTKNANELGFYDMSGNAAEWVNDWYAAYPTGTVVDPKGPDSGEVHVRRGGNRGQDGRYLTVTCRDLDSDLSLTGFRLAMDAPKIQ